MHALYVHVCMHPHVCLCVNMVRMRQECLLGGKGMVLDALHTFSYIVLATTLPCSCQGTHSTKGVSELSKDIPVTVPGDEAVIQAEPLTSPNHRDLRLKYWEVRKPISSLHPALKRNPTEALNARHSAEKTSVRSVYFSGSPSSPCRATLHLYH